MECERTKHDHHFSAHEDTGNRLCESSALTQHVSVTICHAEFLEPVSTAGIHWFRFPVRKPLSATTVYLSDKTSLVQSRKLSH